MSFWLDVERAETTGEIKAGIEIIFQRRENILPERKDARILVKPNLNSHFNALTGNTTDLRVVAGIVESLQYRGYSNITIAEGTNSGFHRNGINTIARLRFDRLAERYGVGIVDLNDRDSVERPLYGNVTTNVAKDIVDCDFLINVPKLKCHHEVQLSLSVKNLMGTLAGERNKKRMHESLQKNLVMLSRTIKPDLIIMDGVIAMEGNGPSAGTPVDLGIILASDEPYIMDTACAIIAGYTWDEVPYLRIAHEWGDLSDEHLQYVDSLDLRPYCRKLKRPQVGFLLKAISHPLLQPRLIKLRSTRIMNLICGSNVGGALLEKAGIRQESFIKQDAEISRIYAEQASAVDNHSGCFKNGNDSELCQGALCMDYCPMSLSVEQIGDREAGCIECLYCYMKCRCGAIQVDGNLGFINEQLRRYDDIVRKAA